MAYKSLLTILTEPGSVSQTLAVSTMLAGRGQGHLEVLCLALDRGRVGPPRFEAETTLVRQDNAEAGQTAAAIAGLVTARLKSEGLRWSVDSTAALPGALSDLVAGRARFTDLMIVPKPSGKDTPTDADLLVEAALFRARVPVLVLPAARWQVGTDSAAFGQEVVLAWNESTAALNAIRAALPLLRAAGHVTIAIIDPQPNSAERSDPGGALSQFLAWHGVRAEVAVLARSQPRIADVLARVLRDRAADFLVLGAHGQSRFHGVTLGGTTRAMLDLAEVPVLMAA